MKIARETTPLPFSTEWRALAAIIVACVLWGASFPLGKLALRAWPAAHVVLGRFVLASGLLLPLALLQNRTPVKHRDVPKFVLAGLLMVPISFLLQFEGLARTNVTSASLIVGAFPPLLALGAFFVARERLSGKGWGLRSCPCSGWP